MNTITRIAIDPGASQSGAPNGLSFFVACNPPRATAQQKGAFVMAGKVRFFKKARIKQAENDLVSLLRPHVPSTPFDGPLLVTVQFRFPFKKTERKADVARGWAYSDTRPDVDNLCKLLFDAMSLLGFWRDDSQIAVMRATKIRSAATGIGIDIARLVAGECGGGE